MKLTIGFSKRASQGGDGIGHYTIQLMKQLELENVRTKQFAFAPLRGQGQLNHNYTYLVLRGLLSNTNAFCPEPQFDLYHSTDFKVVPMKCPVIATLWDAIPFAHPEWISSSFRGWVFMQLMKKSVCFADHIVTASNHAARDIMKYFKVRENRISVIPCGIDDLWYDPLDQGHVLNVLKKYGLNETGYFLSVGTLQPRKNYERLIDAYQALPLSVRQERKLVIIGRNGWKSEKLLQKIQFYAKEGSIHWLPNVDSDDDLRHLYKGAGVFVFPSLYEGFGLPLVEAFASGVSVISSNATSIPEISRGAAVEVDPCSISELREAMMLLALNSAEREKRVQLGLLRAADYRWEKVMPLMLDLYKNQLNGK